MNKTTLQRWKDGIEQIKSISSEKAQELSMFSKNIVKVCLLILPFYSRSKYKNKVIPLSLVEIENLNYNLNKYLNPASNWNYIWHLHKDYQRIFNYDKPDSFELYPALSVLARVEFL